MATARIDALRQVLDSHDTQRKRVIHILNEHGKGITPPWETAASSSVVQREVSQPFQRRAENETGDSNTIDDLRERVLQGVHGMIDTNTSSVFSKKLIQTAVDESFRLIKSDSSGGKSTPRADASSSHVGLDIVRNMINDLSLSKDEVDNLVSRIERDHGDNGLRRAVNQVLDKEASAAHTK